MAVTISPGNGDVTISVSEDTATITTSAANVELSIPTTNTDALEYLNGLNVYDSDDAALAGGVSIGGYYFASNQHATATGGALIKIIPLT